jgi:hypothetical protein
MKNKGKGNKCKPVKQIRQQTAEHKSLDARIRDLMAEGPLAALYFTAGINVLREQVDTMSDEDVTTMFSSLLHPGRVRSSVDYIYKVLNNLK